MREMMPEMGMDVKDRMKLQKFYENLIEVMYNCISPHLISTFVLDLEMHAEIESKPTERKKMEKLLMILPSRGRTAMQEFVKALKQNYLWLANALEQNDLNNNNCSDICSQEKCGTSLIDISIEKHAREVEKILLQSPRICSHWAFLARSMEIKPSILFDIKREMIYSGGLEFAIQKLLESWIADVASKATFGKLAKHLRNESMNKSAEDIEDLWSKLQ